MSESEPTPERPSQTPTREQVVDAYKMLVERGYTHPAELPGDDPDVIQVEEMFYKWRGAAERNPSYLDPAVRLEHRLSTSMLRVDAGFTDRGYLDEVANGWLVDDLEEAEELGLVDMAARISAKRDEINAAIERGTTQANRERLISAATEALGAEVVQGLIELEIDNQDLEWAILLDVRYTEQLERDGVIEGAIRGDLNEIVWRFDPRERAWRDRRIPVGRKVRILVICNQGYCSSIAAAALVLMGYKATDVAGGYQAWIAEGLPRRPYDAVRDVY